MAEKSSDLIPETKEREGAADCVVIVHGHTIPNKPHQKPFVKKPDNEKPLTQEDGSESETLPIWLTDTALLRAYAAGLLWEAGFGSGAKTLLIISGAATGGNEKPTEAVAIKQLIKIMFPHIPSSQILLEEEAYNTIENAKNVQQLLSNLQEHQKINADNKNFQTLLLTSRYHLKRAQKTYERTGVDVIPTADIDVIQSSFYEFLENYDDEKLSYSDMKNIVEKQKRHLPTEVFFRLVDKIDPEGKITQITSRLFRQ